MTVPNTSLYPSTTLYPSAVIGNTISSALGGSVTLTSSLAYTKRITSSLSAAVTLTSKLGRSINSPLSGSATLTSTLSGYKRKNHSSNPSFEVDLTSVSNNYTGSTLTRETSGGYAGSAFSRLTWTTAAGAYTGSMQMGGGAGVAAVGPGKLYVSVMVRVSVAQTMLVNMGGTGVSGVVTTLTEVPANTWTRVPATATVAANTFPILTVSSNAGGTNSHLWGVGETLDVDAVSIQMTPGDYFDGSSSASGFSYAWLGTVGKSASTEIPAAGNFINSNFSGSVTLTSALHRRINSQLSGSVTLTSTLHRSITSNLSGSATLTTALVTGGSTPTPRTNLIPNPSFEVDTTGWVLGVRDNANAVGVYSGSWYGGFTSATVVKSVKIAATAGLDYTASAYFTKVVTLTRSGAISLRFFDASDVELSAPTVTLTALTLDTPTRRISTRTAPAGTAKMEVWLHSSHQATTVMADAVLLEQASTAGTYFDGATPDAGGIDYAWAGTPHASASTATPASAGQTIDSQFSGSATLTSVLSVTQNIQSSLSAEVTLTSYLGELVVPKVIESWFTAQAVLYSELGYVVKPAELGTTPLGKLVSFNVSTSATPLNPAEGAGGAPSVSAGYIKGADPEFALGETNVLSWGTVGTYEGEVVRLSLPEGSDVASVSQDTALTLLNTELSLFPFIDAAPSLWTAARAIDYWSQQCGLFYDKVPGDCIAYASGFGHADSYAAQSTARFYEKLAGGATTTVVSNNRSVKTLGSAVTGTTAFHELPEATTPVSVPTRRRLVASIGLGLRGTGRTATVTWNMVDANQLAHNVTLTATSAGSISAAVGGLVVDTATVPAGADYRITFSLERLSANAVVGKLTAHTDDLAGNGGQVYSGFNTGITYAFPAVAHLTSITHASAGGSGAEMLRWGTYLSVALGHPSGIPAVQKDLSQTKREFGFVSGFEGNVWAMLHEYCAITRQDVSFLDSKLTVIPRRSGLTAGLGSFSRFSRDAERREKYKQVAVVNNQSKAVTDDTAVLWRADSVFQVAAREVFETTVQTGHSILSLVQPAAVNGIWPFPYKQGGGQYVVTGADGYIIAPEWWYDNGGKVEVSLTGKAGEIAIKITAPTIDTVRAPYRISEGEADRPALYISGSGILNDPKEVHVGTGAKNAREGFDNLFESPFIAGPMETYDTAAAMAAQYSASVADVSFELPNDFYTPSRFGQFPAGMRFTDGKRAYRITDASQSHAKVSGNAEPHTTIGDYVASYPAGSTIADEKARHAGRTIKQFNISPLRGK
jgi:hypothetical protein